ncbi:XdhC family protein [Limnobacter humi]|uniref:XdhC family protein n=1 Tax=Limnobacter humi TaxID=1778671 RepID=A0ABT1WFL3_9BURK|nr:XdhC family protein [Limnobacter humi]MCQ8896314.1 XdhC family protein [Limnobacter humi]
MDTMDAQVLNAALQWAAQGHRFATVTVARTWGSAPRPPGAWMVVRHDGQVVGSVSGGCIEDDLIHRVTHGEFNGTAPLALKYGVTTEEANRFNLPCGGTLELVLEPSTDLTALETLRSLTHSGALARRTVDLTAGTTRVEPGERADTLQWTGQVLTTVHGPRLRLLLIGASQISRYVAPMAHALGYEVLVCDPREEYYASWDVPNSRWLPGMPDDVVLGIQPDVHTAIVALTHDPKLDDLALMEALRSPAFYVGALGSKANNARRKARLKEHFELQADELERLHGPVGLPIGSRTPPEIAVSLLAELTQVKNQLHQQPTVRSACTTPADGVSV